MIKITLLPPELLLRKLSMVDGAGSGLNADKVDGLEASQFLRKDVADSKTGDLTFPDANQGVILQDRASAGDFYRLYIDTGALKVEKLA